MKKKIILASVVILSGIALLTGCTLFDSFGKDLTESFKGLPVTVKTYDVNSQVIDEVKGKSMKIERDSRFDQTDDEGSVSKASKVLSITLGGKEITHVGSSLVAAEDGLIDEFDEFTKTVKIENFDRSTPIVNKMMNEFKNEWNPEAKVVLIRSQQGMPLATFIGDEVAYESTDVPSSTSLLIDGKRLFIYRCDFTIYEMSLFK